MTPSGAPAPLSAEQIARVVHLTLHTKPPNATHWSVRTLAPVAGLSHSSIQRIWSAHGLKPHLTKSFKLSRDPSFLEKLTDVILGREWQRDDGAMMRIERCLIDANWGQSTDVVYQFCRQSPFAAALLPSHGKYVGASSIPFSEYTRKKGDRVGIFMPNTPQFVVAYFGILKAGGVVVAINPLYTPPEIAEQASDAGIEIMFVMTNFYKTIKATQANTKIKKLIAT